MFNRTLSVLVAGAFAAAVGSLAATSATAADPRSPSRPPRFARAQP